MKRETLIKNLKKNVMKIKFTKKNGDERTMRCTLHDSVLPETNINNRKNNDEVLPVWDLDNSGWRSFRLDSIKETKNMGLVGDMI